MKQAGVETRATERGAERSDLIVMGEVLAAYGVQGWLKARTFTASRSGLLAYRSWWLKGSGDWREFAVREARPHGDAIVARLEGFGVREDVAPWRGAKVGVPRTALPPLEAGEVYLADLVGLTVVNRQEATLGRVVGLIETGAHPVLRVSGGAIESSERLIPLVPAYVDAIDLRSRRIVVDWPVGY
jgi:16S rRNA processing protein RimM